MPITFQCGCGKTLQVKDEFAGRRVRCPVCQGAATVPAEYDAFEVIEDTAPPVPPPPEPARPSPRATDAFGQPARAKAEPVRNDDDRGFDVVDDEDDRPRKRRRYEDDEDDRPRRRRYEDDEGRAADRPRKKKKPKAKADKAAHFAAERGVLNSGVMGGVAAMIGAVVWFVVGIVALDRIFFYPPILFVLGLVAVAKGMAGGNE